MSARSSTDFSLCSGFGKQKKIAHGGCNPNGIVSKFFEAMTVRLDPVKTADVHLIVGFRITDSNRGYALEVRRGVAQLHESLPAQADVTLSLTFADLQRIILRQTTFADALRAGEIKVQGKQAELERFFGFFDAPATEPPALTVR